MFVQVKDETTKFKWSQPRVRVTAPVPHMHTNIPFFCVLVFRLYSEADSIPTKLLILPPLIMQLCSDDCSLKQSVWTNSASFPSCSSAKPQSRRSRCAAPPLPATLSFLSPPSHARDQTPLKTSHAAGGRVLPKTAAKPQSSNLLLPIDLPVYVWKGHLTNVDISHMACLGISKLGNLEIFQKKTRAECAVTVVFGIVVEY